MKRLSKGNFNQQLIELTDMGGAYREIEVALGKAIGLTLTFLPNDGKALAVAMQAKPQPYTGIRATLVPVVLGDQIVGFLMAGSFDFYAPAAKCLDDVPSILERLELSGDKIAELRSHYQALDSVGSGRFQSIVDLMKAVSRYLASMPRAKIKLGMVGGCYCEEQAMLLAS
jgi:hypothetical protein